MIKTRFLNVEIEWFDPGFYFCVRNEKNQIIDPDYWTSLLFTWDKHSFFGTDLEVLTHQGKPCVALSPWEALLYFSTKNYSSIQQINWDVDCDWLFENAPVILEAIQNGKFKPDYDEWKNGGFGWKLMDTSLELPFPRYFNKWVSLAIQELINNDHDLHNIWLGLTEAYPLLSPLQEENTVIVDEQDWLEKMEWLEDTTPFKIHLKLTEPANDDDEWQLSILLRDKQNNSTTYELFGHEQLVPALLPEQWPFNEVKRRIEREQNTWMTIAPWLNNDGLIPTHLSDDEAWKFLTDTSETLLQNGVNILLPSWWQEIRKQTPSLKMKISSNFGRRSIFSLDTLVDFNWRISVGKLDLSEEEFLHLVEQKRKLVQINGQWVKLDASFVKYMKGVFKKAQKEGLRLRDVFEQAFTGQIEAIPDEDEDEETLHPRIEIELNKHLQQMVMKLSNTTSIPSIEISDQFKGELRPYQKQGIEWLIFLRQFGFGACLADDMGLGKTIQMIAYFLHAKEDRKTESPALIVCPTSVLGNWQKEIEKFAPSLNVYLHYGSSRPNLNSFKDEVKDIDIVITSYGLAQMDQETLQTVHWSTICIDEAQNIKNPQTKQSQAVRSLNGFHKIALTGTPIENRLTELWAIYDFINQGYLGTLGGFGRRFVTPIEKEEDQERKGQLQKLIRPFLLRRTKLDKEINLELPDKQEQKEYCRLTTEQASLYEQLVHDTLNQLALLDGIQRRGLILSMLTKLKQICNHPVLYLKEDESSMKTFLARSHKMEKLVELVESIYEQNESCLIFTQYVKMGDMIQQFFEQQFSEKPLFLHGGVQKNQRDKMIQQFQEKQKSVFILSLKAGGTGLNLTTANHVIHFDRWWNPAVENQATDRAYRIGQKRFVHVHKLITTGTLEEKIDEMIDTKKALSDDIISGENWITELSTNELQDLFSLRRGWEA